MIGVCVRRYPISLMHGAGLIGCGQLNKDLRALSFRISGCGALTGAVDVFLNPGDYLLLVTQPAISKGADRGRHRDECGSFNRCSCLAAVSRRYRVPHRYAISIVFTCVASYRRMQPSREVLETRLARK